MDRPNGLADHYENPRYLGDLESPDAVAIGHNPVCGDMLRLAAYCRDGRITEVRFKAYGCAAAIAAGSVAAELLHGTSLAEAASLTDEDVVAVLGPLPPMKVHAVVLARETIANLLQRLRPPGGEEVRRLADLTYKTARRVAVTLVGGTVVLLGIIMLVIPGPAMVVIPIGLAILGLEWAWARRLLRTIKEKGGEAFERAGIGERVRRWRGKPAPNTASSTGGSSSVTPSNAVPASPEPSSPAPAGPVRPSQTGDAG